MTTVKAAVVVAAFALFSSVKAHGVVTGIVAGNNYPGYQPFFKYQNPPPTVAGWSIPDDGDTGFVSPDGYANPDIICHKGATPGGAYVTVEAGGSIELQWSKWPESHHGPVLDYLANCNGDCTSVEKTALKFNKIDESGLIDDTTPPGSWASDKLIAANNSWTTTIPKCVAPGNYVLRHEIIALHSSGDANGAQNYPQCINIKVTGSGTDKLASGTTGTALYKSDDPGILVSIYQKLSYLIPGPKLFKCGSSTGDTSSSTPVASSTEAIAPVAPTSASPVSGPTTTAVPIPTTTILSNYTSPFTSKKTKKACPTTSASSAGASGPIETGSIPTPSSLLDTSEHTPPSPTSAPSEPELPDAPSLPSSVLSASLPELTTLPSSTPGGETGGTPPELKYELPKGLTIKQLFELLELVVAELEARMVGGKVRRHARDFLGAI
ncbi:MAG: hypothetical protein Q9190_000165 [Brigantiaea leucoxantha]